jgi:hypothetical protein
MRVRAHVRLVTAIWLTCQVVAFAAAPFALCHDHGAMSQTGNGHECDPTHHHHGQPASSAASHQHHHAGDAPGTPPEGAAVDCRCTVSDAALAALMLETGLLPKVFALVTNLADSRVVLPEDAIPTHTQPIDTPPPRA